MISYLCEKPSALTLWQNGWPHKSRPPLRAMLDTMAGSARETTEGGEIAREITRHFNAIVHADPAGARSQAVTFDDGSSGYTASKALFDHQKCDEICFQTSSYLIVLTARAVEIFSEALD